MFEGSPISGPYRGLDGLRQWREESFDILEDGRLLLDEVITRDDPDVMVVTNRFVGRTRYTRLSADFPLTVVVRLRDGLIGASRATESAPKPSQPWGWESRRERVVPFTASLEAPI